MSDFAQRSYVKTTAVCVALVFAALAFVVAGYLMPMPAGYIAVTLGLTGAVGAGVFACAGTIVLARHRRATANQRDLFLELNATRQSGAIKAGAVRTSSLRRSLVRHLFGHDLVVGDLVEVKSWNEIRETLDAQGCFEQLPFMPEMRAMCGRRAYVFRCMHRLFDYRKTRRMRHMDRAVLLVEAVCDGSVHGGCQAGCHAIWKSAWLRRIAVAAPHEPAPRSPDHEVQRADDTRRSGGPAPRYTCQLTQLHAASRPIDHWSPIHFLRPLVSGNVTVAAFAIGWLTYVFNELQRIRGGVTFPAFGAPVESVTRPAASALKPGDRVIVRPAVEIRGTLNDRLMHRGLWFEPDMLKYCGQECHVQAEIERIIDIVSGEMRTLGTAAYVLRDVHFSGERQLFNSQYEPLYWRAEWLSPSARLPVPREP